MKHQNLDNRDKLCCNCCNVFPVHYSICPFCRIKGGMLINKNHRIQMQIEHLVVKFPLPIISWDVLLKIFKKKIVPGGALLKHPISYTTHLTKEKTNEDPKNKSFKTRTYLWIARIFEKRDSR